MTRIVLVHGFATGITYSCFRHARGEDAGFTAFRKDITEKTAKVFRWGISDEASFFESLDPRFSMTVLKKERCRAQNIAWQERLFTFLAEEQPTIIVCHSLGCQFMLDTLNNLGVPESVRTIVFNQSAIPKTAELKQANVQARIDAHTLQCLNTYCPWDPTLWVSAIVHLAIPEGLFPTAKPWMKNVFFPLYLPVNLHTSAIRSKRFRAWVKSFSN